jgi:uncharacterized protein (TIGR03086 family)
MTEVDPVELYRRATVRAVEVARNVQPEQLLTSTPCAEWTVQDLLDHLVGGTQYLGMALGAEPSESTTRATADDLAAGVAGCLDRLEDPAALAHRSASPLGFEWSGAEATAGTFMDVLVHTWDLASATGQDPALDPDLVDACVAMFLPDMPERGRAAGIVGPAVSVPPGASPQDRLLGAMGRQP